MKAMSEEFDVAIGTLYKISTTEKWAKRLLAMEAVANDSALAILQKTMDEAALDHIKIAQKMQVLGMQALEELGAPVSHSEALALLKTGVAMEKAAREMPRAEQHLTITVNERYSKLLAAPSDAPVKMLDDHGKVVEVNGAGEVDADFSVKDEGEQ